MTLTIIPRFGLTRYTKFLILLKTLKTYFLMKYPFVLTCALLISMLAFSQKIKVTLGPILDHKERLKSVDIPLLFLTSAYAENLFDTLSNKTINYVGVAGKNPKLVLSDDYVKLWYTKPLSAGIVMEGDNETFRLISFVSINKKLFVFYSMHFAGTDQFSVYAKEVSKDYLTFGSPILIHSYSDLKENGNSVSLGLSRNNQYILLYRDIETKRRESQKFECKVIDASFAEVWNRAFELENTDKEEIIQRADINNSGDIFVLSQKEKKPESGPLLHFYRWKDKVFKTVSLGPAEGDNFGVRLEIVDGVKPYIIGLNQQKKSVSCFVDRFDVASATLQHLSNTPMPEDFYKASNFNKFETKHWGVSDIVSLENHNLVASIEARLVVTVNEMPRAYYTYYTFINAFSENGSLKYQHTVRKIQGSANELIGLSLIPYKNIIVAIYNDHPDNLKLSPSEKKIEGYTGQKEAMIVVQQIDESGKVSKYQLTTDPSMKNWSINLDALVRIKGGLYYSIALNRKGMLSIDARALTFEIK
jgi:hypothetical protein